MMAQLIRVYQIAIPFVDTYNQTGEESLNGSTARITQAVPLTQKLQTVVW